MKTPELVLKERESPDPPLVRVGLLMVGHIRRWGRRMETRHLTAASEVMSEQKTRDSPRDAAFSGGWEGGVHHNCPVPSLADSSRGLLSAFQVLSP